MEYQTEKEAFRKQTEAIGLGRKVKRGDAWYPVGVGQAHYNSLNQMTVDVTRTQDTDVEHNFEYGKPVMFFSFAESGGRRAILPYAIFPSRARCRLLTATAW